MKSIDLDHWPRRSQYGFFRGYDFPHFSVTANVDVSRLMQRRETMEGTVFNACLFAITGAANDTAEFRMRFRDEKVFECETVGASITVPIAGRKFAFCDIGWSPDRNTFEAICNREIEAATNQSELENKVAGLDNWIYMTCLPWVHLTAMTHPLAGPDDCIPRIAWGKIEATGDGHVMPVAVQVHHALVDGVHVGLFFEALQTRLDSI